MKSILYPGISDEMVQDQIEAAIVATQELIDRGVMFLAIPLLSSDDLLRFMPLQEERIERLRDLVGDEP